MGISCVDTILANINFNVLEENAKNLSMLLKTGSVLIISGILSNDENNIVSVFVKNEFVKKQLSQKEEWIALVFEKQ